MDPKQEPTLEESIKQVMQTLPPVIRNYLAQGKYSVVAQNLMATYSLHIDQGGILEREIMLLLMGIENPAEFISALVEEAKIDPQTVNKIVQDVNEQVFIPLKEAEMKSDEVKAEPLVKSEMPKVSPPSPATLPSPSVDDEKLLEDHEEPSIVLDEANDLVSLGINKIPFPIKPKVVSPPENLPGALVAPKINLTPPVPAKPYSVDPYREPIE
jgi:hypothetical protein